CRAGGNGGPGKRLRIAKNRCTMDKRARRMMRQPYTLHPVRGARYLCEHPPLASGQRGFPTGNPAGAGSGGLPNPAVCGAPAADGIPRSKI
ncbi:TPA: hypothetical protein ACJYAW_002245, partial [Neisseria gonorrhoeae]